MPEPVSFGLLASLLAFLLRKQAKKLTTDEVLAALGNQNTIRDYEEWIRRKDHAELIGEVQSSRDEVAKLVAELSPQLSQAVAQAQANAIDLADKFQELSAKVLPPVLSPTPVETRVGAPIALRCRVQEVGFLKNSTGDVLVWGQPGTGKTALLTAFCQQSSAQFLLTANEEAAVSAVLVNNPNIVIVDDAWTRRGVIQRVGHARSSYGIPLRIVAVCWPFEKEEMQQLLQVPSNHILELERLPKREIAGIVKEISSLRQVSVNDEFLRFVIRQARGRPGLAVSLTLAALESSTQQLVSGELLLRDLDTFLKNHVGKEARTILAAVACGGTDGIGLKPVADVLGKSVSEVKATVDKVALAGIIEQTSKDALAVQPDLLRAALIRNEFFPVDGVGLGWEVCEALITASVRRSSSYLELLRARSYASAQIDDELLHTVALEENDEAFWSSLAWLDKANCSWVLGNCSEMSVEIKKAALHYCPGDIIPSMLSSADREKLSPNAFPESDLRLIQDWVHESTATEAQASREALFDSTANWLRKGGSAAIGFQVLEIAFDLSTGYTDSDPAASNVMRIHGGVIGIESVRRVFDLWPKYLQLVREQSIKPWTSIIRVVDHLKRRNTNMGHPLPADHIQVLQECVRQMIQDLLPIAKGNQAVGRWIFQTADSINFKLSEQPASDEFLVLYPPDSMREDWEAQRSEQVEAVRKLVDKWKDRPFLDTLRTFSLWDKQAQELNDWSEMPFVFWSTVADSRSLSEEELLEVIDSLQANYAGVFIRKAAAAGNLAKAHIDKCLERQDLQGIIIELAVTGRSPQLLEQIRRFLPDFANLLMVESTRDSIPEDLVQSLLTHEDVGVRCAVALGVFRAQKGGTIPSDLLKRWRSAVLDGLSTLEFDSRRDLPYDLDKILACDPTLAPELLSRLLDQKNRSRLSAYRNALPGMVQQLSKQERSDLLAKCKGLHFDELPDLLVGNDLDLYQQLLGSMDLREYHLSIIAGDPTTQEWPMKAKLALAAGYGHEEIAASVQGRGYQWSGELSSYWQQWVDRFQKLHKSDDPDLVCIAEAGLKWANANRDHHLRQERKREIDG